METLAMSCTAEQMGEMARTIERLAALKSVRAPEANERAAARQADADDSNCVVCFENERTHAFVPCGHKCICESCCGRLGNKTAVCPMCREPYTAVMKVFG